MPQSSTLRHSSTNQPLTARVVRVTPAGLIVKLSNGSEGLVREREIGWDAKTRESWAERYPTGTAVQVIPIGKGRKRRPELSMRLAQVDSWREIKQRYPAGNLVDGEVTGVMPYGVFVELEPGISGLVHTSRLPLWAGSALGAIFWPGDLVKVTIENVDVEQQRIRLSMTDLPQQRWIDHHLVANPPLHRVEKSINGKGSRPTLAMLFEYPRQSVLVIEDDDAQRKAVTGWLRNAGQTAEGAASAEEALNMVPSIRPDLALIDVGLPGMDGIQAAHEIKARWPETRCALMTDWSRAERRADDLQPLREKGVSLLIKPLLPEDLLNALLGQLSPLPLSSSTSKSPAYAMPERSEFSGVRGRQDNLTDLVLRLHTVTRADKVVLFEMDIEGRRVKVMEQRGAIPLRLQATPELIHSPVRDVAEDGQLVIARNAAATAARRFVHLKPLLDFEACVGVPAPVQLPNQYALFLFFARAAGWSDATVAIAENAAVAIAAWLERRQILKQTADFNRIAVLGQMGRALVHEISGRLTPINLALEKLQAGCDQVEHCAANSPEQVVEEARLAKQELQNLRQQAEALARTTRSFSRMTRQGQEEIVVLEEIVGEAVDVLKDAAETAHVKIQVQPPPRVFFTRTQVTHLQQVMVNIVQNAIQQIHLLRPKAGGRVEIRLAQSMRDGESMMRLCVEDDGPGIHRRLWKRVFEMDYTTRSEGSGLGLYMSRSLIEAQGGRVFVEDSHMLWGSTFVVELPYRV